MPRTIDDVEKMLARCAGVVVKDVQGHFLELGGMYEIPHTLAYTREHWMDVVGEYVGISTESKFMFETFEHTPKGWQRKTIYLDRNSIKKIRRIYGE